MQRPGDGASSGSRPAEYHPGVAARTADNTLSRRSRPAPDIRRNEAKDKFLCETGWYRELINRPGRLICVRGFYLETDE